MKLSERMKGKTGWDEPISDEQVEDWADKVAQLEEAIAKYEEPATCNGGHKTLPLKLWDCPECTAQLKAENAKLKRELDTYKYEFSVLRQRLREQDEALLADTQESG